LLPRKKYARQPLNARLSETVPASSQEEPWAKKAVVLFLISAIFGLLRGRSSTVP
jgi:hypothetical protein